jgi:hypothetical protein
MSSRFFWSTVVLVCLCGSAHGGLLEICKVSDPPGSLIDPYYFFNIEGQPTLQGILVPVDACTDTIILPVNGDYTIDEVPDPSSTLESVSTFPGLFPSWGVGGALLSFDLQAGTATVQLSGGSDPTDLSQEVTVYFENTPIPEPGTAWLLGLGLTVWALRGKPAMRPYLASLRNATNSVMRRT